MNDLRKTLPPVPAHMQSLPIDERGYPVPWFVTWNDGKPDFRLLDEHKFIRAVREGRCSVCGKILGRFKSFVGGPMNVLQLISGEPPMHHDCATFSVRACPFLLHPMAKRRSANLPDNIRNIGESGDVFYEGNPGITSIVTCTRFRMSPSNRVFHIENMDRLEWFTQGREATPDEIREGLIAARDRLQAIYQQQEAQS